MYGVATPEQYQQFFAYLRAGVPGWKVVYDQQGVLLAQYTGP
jgi:hypothetical protein